jgi:CBS domain-containing membrane protein
MSRRRVALLRSRWPSLKAGTVAIDDDPDPQAELVQTPSFRAAHAGWGERLRVAVGIFLGVALTGLIGSLLLGPFQGLPLLVAPMGASAVLLFGVPASPLAQPWPILGGNLVAACVGVTAARWVGSPLLAAGVAAACTYVLMVLLRCLHPPSGSVALTAVLGGPHIASLGYGFVSVPIGVNTLVLVFFALIYNNLTRASYPYRAGSSPRSD